jgi:eukaryotic translation initiation factor 2C
MSGNCPRGQGNRSGGSKKPDNAQSLPIRPAGGAGGAVEVWTPGVGAPPIDKHVEDEENARLKINYIDPAFPRRPGYGDKGKPIELRANFFRLITNAEEKKKEVQLYCYTVDAFAPKSKQPATGAADGLSKPKRQQLMRCILQERPEFKDVTWASDFSKIIVTTTELKLESKPFEFKIDVRDPTLPAMAPPAPGGSAETIAARNRRTTRVRIDLTGRFVPSQLLEYLNSKAVQPTYGDRDTVIQILNIIIGNTPQLRDGTFQVGSKQLISLVDFAH